MSMLSRYAHIPVPPRPLSLEKELVRTTDALRTAEATIAALEAAQAEAQAREAALSAALDAAQARCVQLAALAPGGPRGE